MHGNITNFPKLGDGQRVSVSAIPERSEKSVLHFAKKRGIKVVVLDKYAGLYSVFVANGKNMCIAIFRVYDTSGMDFYPCADGSVGWRDKIQLDLFEKGN
jgi:hypothetical protein